jgi:hypothetical protein
MRVRFRFLTSARRRAVAAVFGLVATVGLAGWAAGCDDESSVPASPGSDTNPDATSPAPTGSATHPPDDASGSDGDAAADQASEAGNDDAGDGTAASDSGSGDGSLTDAAPDGPNDASADATGAGLDGGSDAAGPDASDAAPDSGAGLVDASHSIDPGFDAGTPTFTAIYADIITPNCLNCHAQPPPLESMLFMGTQADAYNNLVNVRAMGDACLGSSPDGGSPVRVIPGDAADSLLFLKITNTQACGSGMPEDSDSLTPAQILTIETWIDQGAAND